MKKRILSSLLIAFAFAITAFAQTTALVAYDGGYFVKNGDRWTEYRPQDKAEPWNEYKQYNENDTFYFLDSKRCRVQNNLHIRCLYPCSNRTVHCRRDTWGIH